MRIRAQAKVQGQSAQTVRQELGHQSEYLKKATSINEVLSKHFRAQVFQSWLEAEKHIESKNLDLV